jgi:ketosteroid isomerase-like protein
MSEENVELYRQTIQALNRRDLGAFLAVMDADVEAVPTVVALEGDLRGHDAVRRWYASVLDVFPDFTIEVITVRDLGDLTLAAVGFRGHGAGSATPFEMTLWSVAEWREGKCVWSGNYRSEAEALEAVRLRE